MQQPNFFIIGAPKCGTSTVLHTLRDHPQAYVPLSREPHFFSTDLTSQSGWSPSPEWYASLFEDATDSHIAVGEKSVSYLYSEEAIPNILDFSPDAKLIVCLRNPVEMIPSWHAEACINLREDQASLEKAWEFQEARRKGQHIARLNRFKFILQYKEIGMLGKNLQRVHSQIDKSRMHTVFLDDIKNDFANTHTELLEFLELSQRSPPKRRAYQIRREHRSKELAYMLHDQSTSIGARAVRRLVRSAGPFGRTLLYRARELNKKKSKRRPLPPKFREKLYKTFRDDIQLLSELTDRDLSHWS